MNEIEMIMNLASKNDYIEELEKQNEEFISELNKKDCSLCSTWKGNKRYKFCPDCGKKLIRE